MTDGAGNKSENKEPYRLPVGQLYPELTPEQCEEVEHFLTQYLEVVNRIFEEKYNLTGSDLNTTFKPPADSANER